MSNLATTLFISDLHLDPRRPDVTQSFMHFMRDATGQAEAIYILGDFFNAFIGEDDTSPFVAQIKAECLGYTSTGGKLFLMAGNRDFLMEQRFAKAIGAHLLADPSMVECYGHTLLLMHGDSLCTDDLAHQRWRGIYTQRWIRRLAHWIPLFIRQGMATRMRRYSTERKTQQPAAIMDVNADAVQQALNETHADYLIHGHTHKPGDHGKRLVLGEWPDKGAIIKLTSDGQFTRLNP
jgi:UDP-2,3-diacylglucosamine hydrolase